MGVIDQDRAAVVEAIEAYGRALDDRDGPSVVACFTPGARLEYFGGEIVVQGTEAIAGFFSFDRPGGLPGLDEILRTTHLWNPGPIVFDGEQATVTTNCVAHLLGRSGDQRVLVTRGLHYDDVLERGTDGRWRIAGRRHVADWETRTPTRSGSANELTADDRLAIHELAGRYGTVIDDGDWDRLDEVFTSDATFETRGFGGVDGRREGIGAIRQMMLDSPVHPVAHHVTNIEVFVDGPLVKLWFKVIGPGRKGRVGSADYRDLVRKEPAGWRIATHVTALRREPVTAVLRD